MKIHGVLGRSKKGNLKQFFADREKERSKLNAKDSKAKKPTAPVVSVEPEIEEEAQNEEGPQVVVVDSEKPVVEEAPQYLKDNPSLKEMAKYDIPDVDSREQNLELEETSAGFLEIAKEEREAFEAITPEDISVEEVEEPKPKKKAVKKKRKYTRKKTTVTS